jgi:hypothetical protein
MSEIPLARLWRLPDGTTCLLLKDPRVASWELQVIRDGETIRHERFGSPIVAMEEAKQWRAGFDSSLHQAT